MAFKLNGSTAGTETKLYLFPLMYAGAGVSHWMYVTDDAHTTVDGSAYITASTSDDHQRAIDMLKVGDLIWVYQCGSISDTQTIQDDMAAGITDITLHAVLVNNGSIIDLSDDLFGGDGGTFAGVVTYGD